MILVFVILAAVLATAAMLRDSIRRERAERRASVACRPNQEGRA